MRRKIGLALFLLLALGAILLSGCTVDREAPAPPNTSAEQAAVRAVNAITTVDAGYRLSNPRHTALFTSEGVRFTPQAGPVWSWQLVSVGAGDSPLAAVEIKEVQPSRTESGAVFYPRGGLTERYLARVDCVEQQFVIPQPLTLHGADLVISGEVSSDGAFESASQGWLWHDPAGVVSLGKAYVFDAAGREIPAVMHVSAHRTRLQVDGAALARAEYPVTIDPEIGTNDFRISDMGADTNTTYAAFDVAVAYNSVNNEYLVVWSGDDNSGSLAEGEIEIFGQRINAATGAEVGNNDFRISDMGPDGDDDFDAFNPAVAYISSTNEYLVVWHGDDNSGDLVDDELEIFGQRIYGDLNDGDEVGNNDFRISDMGTDGDSNFDAFNPAVAYNSTDNECLVVWHGDDNSGDLVDGEVEIFGQRIYGNRADGDEVGNNDFRLSDMGPDGSTAYRAQYPAVIYNSTSNEYLVVWEGDDNTAPLVNGEFEIFGQRVYGDRDLGDEIGADTRLSDMGTDRDTAFGAYRPAVAYNGVQNEFLVVWMGDDDSGSLIDEEYEIYAQRVDAAGVEVGSNDFRISDMGATDGQSAYAAYNPQVAYDDVNQKYLVVWRGDDDSDSLVDDEFEIYGQRVNAAGMQVGLNDFRISDMGDTDGTTTFYADRPAVAYNSTDDWFIIVWQGDDEVGTLVDDEIEALGQQLAEDTDTDGDGIADYDDNCPDDANPGQEDGDGDEVGNVCDNCPDDANAGQEDADGDEVGDVCDDCTDTDGDGFGNPGFPANTCSDDNCPNDANADQADGDDDGVGNVCDNCPGDANPGQEDDDSDGDGDVCDNCPNDANADQADGDGDGDGDVCDNCPNDDNPDQANSDADTLGDVCDNCPDDDNQDQADADGDRVGDVCDNCPNDANADQANSDADTLGDVCDNCPDDDNQDQADTDGDGVGNVCDNCPDDANPGQEDADGDNVGNACETDDDDDGVLDDNDNCPVNANPDQTNSDGDTLGDVCDNCPNDDNQNQADADEDGVGNVCDNCLNNANTGQEDADSDDVGDACDNCPNDANTGQEDVDGDTYGDACDNCPNHANAGQEDADSDDVGDACDNCPNHANAGQEDADSDDVGDVCDNCPNHANEDQANLDGDGLGNVCDDTANNRPTSTGSGLATLHTNAGYFSSTAGVGNPCPNPPNLIFPHGWFSFTIEGLIPGIEATVTITLPDTTPTDTQYWKCGPTAANPVDHWYQILMGDNDGDNVIFITITDGGDGDDDLTANGTIIEPGGPGQRTAPPIPVGGYIIPVDQPELLAPWLALAALASLTALTAALVRRHKPTAR